MTKPTPQYVQKLEQELRMLYRQQHVQLRPAAWSLGRLFKLLIPVASSAFVIALLLFSFILKTPSISPVYNPDTTQNTENSIDPATQKILAFDEGSAEDDIINDFDGDELTQIDQGISLVVAN